MRRRVVFADGAQHKPGPAFGQEPPHGNHQSDGGIDKGVLMEQHRPDEGNIGQQGNFDLADARALHAHKGRADHAGKPKPQNGQSQPRRHLIGRKAQHKCGKNQGQRHTRQHRHQHAKR